VILLERRHTDFGTITVLKRKVSGAVIYEQHASRQSEADRTGISLASYVHAMFDFLLQNNAERVLMIGCGGGTLATMLARVARHATVVDVNPDAFDLARRHFGMPPEVVCHVADGRDHLLSHAERYDAIVLDAYDGDRAPAHLHAIGFLRLAAARLEPQGMFLANVHVEYDADMAADHLAHAASAAWPDVRLLDAPGFRNRNAVVAAGHVGGLRLPAVRLRPSEGLEEITHELNTSSFRGWRNLNAGTSA
jgi:spermidine synthase